MEVNKTIYPDFAYRKGTTSWTTSEIEQPDIICSNNLLSHGLNTDLNTTITYACSTSQYASKNASTTYGARYSGEGIAADTYIIPNTSINSYQGVFLARNKDNIVDVQGSKTSYLISGGFSPAGDYSNRYANIYPVTAFKYHSIVAFPIIGYCVKNGSNDNSISYTSLDGWKDVDKSNHYICTLAIGVVSGSEKSRTNTDVAFANMNGINAVNIAYTDEGYKVLENKTIYNHFSDYVSGVPSRYCFIHSGVDTYPNSNYMEKFPGYRNTICQNMESSFAGTYDDMWGGNFICKYIGFNLSENDILHITATFGLIFTTSYDKARTYNLSYPKDGEEYTGNLFDDDLYFPILENNLWQGNFTHGENNKNAQQYKEKWNDDINAPFNNGSNIPSGDLPKYGDDNLTAHGGSTSALTHRYVVDNSKMQSISNYINNVDDNLFTAIVNNMKMSGESPINSIVSVMYSPIDISTYAPTTENIIIGTNFINVGTAETPTALTGNKLTTDSVIFNLGECTINPKNKNYLDYEPYTKYVCYIPFCNFVEMESSIIMGKKLGFQLICDLVAGSCEGIIRIGGLNGRIYKSVGGTFATQCSVQGLDSANYVNGIVSSLGKYVGGIGTMIGATVGVATGGVSTAIAGAGLLAGLGTTASAIYDINTTSKNYSATGKSIGLIGQRMPLHVCIYKFECEDNSDTNYGDFVGYACEFSETLSNLNGFTVCANAKVEANATNTEKEKIKALLETGVYL